ncbi:hypothetical protein [Fusobacterium sp.]|uniref:hypothetical protein n=1 Tax=Fusobacterium sp. TaxID=68766 RepID=UPI0028FFCFC2|nr:hypothetical protein [Fusobacterium sp.]MDU1909613.1 hypothetical protein [Fusobacterium sp.]
MKKLLFVLILLIFIIPIIFLANKNFDGIKTPRLKNDISRVDVSGTYKITFDELVELLKEIDPTASIKVDNRVKKFTEQNGDIRDHYKSVIFSSHEIRGYFNEEKEHLTAVAVYSKFGISKAGKNTSEFNTTVEFDKGTINNFKSKVLIVNNILNSSNSQKEMTKFLKNTIKKEIKSNQKGEVGDSTIYLYKDINSIVIEFIPK